MRKNWAKFMVGMVLAGATLGLLFLKPGLSQAGECQDPIIWKDDFEDYTPGQYPSPHWTHTGNSDLTVDDSKSAQGNQSLRVHASPGGCWEAIPCRLMEVSTSEGFTIEFYIYISSDHREGCHSWTGGAGMFDVCDWTRAKGVGIIAFWYDGSITSRIGDLGMYADDTWYKIKMKYERENPDTVKLSYWIDDVFKGTQSVSAASYEDDLTYLHFSTGDGTIWVDEIEVRCLMDEAQGIISGFVTDTSYTPIASARVNLIQGGTLLDSTLTNAAGHYEFISLVDGVYRVMAGKPGYGRDRKPGRVQQATPWGKDEFVNFILGP
jgi:hypothetical protein